MYQAPYTRMPGAQQVPMQRRQPLTNAVNHQVNHETPPKPPPKAPASPPLPRQNSKTAPPSPPKQITDKTGRLTFSRVGFLGEGGFARVYEVKDSRGSRLACKVVTKSSLKTKKAKTKLYAEIKIHRSLQHPNIVMFQDCFEDTDNVYMTLELCPSGSLMDMLRRRRRFTEPEARFFMVQLIGACHYMHTHQVIHRDLKLGNLFLDANMNVKVGDFGLAALIENPGERKKTICGTPNYIAPEVLFDTANGHSFEVDTWSVGVILYTLVVGRPPFQTKDVKAIYKRIRDNEYEFPTDRVISSAVQHLIQQILTPDPAQRPTLHEIVDHAFFTQGPVPSYIPTSAHDAAPDFRHISKAASDSNLKRLRKYSLLDVDFSSTIPVPGASTSAAGGATASTSGDRTSAASVGSGVGAGVAPARTMTTSIAQQEKEFQKAVQPGSPISALLSSARQPLLMGTTAGPGGPGGVRESPLLRKLQAVKESPLGRRSVTRGLDGIVEEREGGAAGTGVGVGSMRRRQTAPMGAGPASSADEGEHEEEELRLRKKELEAQKARIVAQMAPVREEAEPEDDEDEEDDRRRAQQSDDDEVEIVAYVPAKNKEKERATAMSTRDRYASADRENVAPSKYASRPARERGVSSNADKENYAAAAPSSRGYTHTHHAQAHTHNAHAHAPAAPAVSPPPPPPTKLAGFEAAAHILTLAFDAKAAGRTFRTPQEYLPLPDERVFIVSWVDYCNKYGMGYALTDGSVGVHFNDSTSCILSPDKVHFDYLSAHRQGAVFMRKSYGVDDYPVDLKSKVYLLKHFEKYIMERLYGEYEYTFTDAGRATGMAWVQKYLRMKHVIVFKLSHDVLQFNFYDHSKLILSSHGNRITHIDKHYKRTRWTLSDVLAFALEPPAHANADELKFNQRLVDKLRYCKEVLISICNASSGDGVPVESDAVGAAFGAAGTGAGTSAGAGAPAAADRMGSIASKTSRMTLR